MSKYKNIVICVLSLIAILLLIVITTPKASALVMKYSDYTKTINNTTYYGYDVPTRPNPFEFGTKVNLGSTTKLYEGVRLNDFSVVTNNSYTFFKASNFNFAPLDNYIRDNNITLSDISYNMTEPIKIDGPLYPRLMNYTWSFSLGDQGGLSEMFSDGRYFDYNDSYSFEYDIVLFDSSLHGHLGTSLNLPDTPTISTNYNGFLAGNNLNSSSIGLCSQPVNNGNFNWSCSSGNQGYGYTVTKKYSDSHLQVLTVKINFNEYLQFRFSKGLSQASQDNGITIFESNTPSTTTDYINYFNNVNNTILNKSSDGLDTQYVYLFFSMPRNLVVWSTESSTFCQGNSCWTQADTDSLDNKKTIDSSNTFIDDILNSINGLLQRDYGFSGIVNLTFDFIKDILQGANNYCHVYRIQVFNKNIVLPCGTDFWERNDIWTFKITYELVFTGVVAYYLCWKIYKDLLNAINPNTKITTGNEVDSL